MMNSDDESDHINEDQIINLISALQQKIKSSRQGPEKQGANQSRMANDLPDPNQERSKNSSISENLSDMMIRTDKQMGESEQLQIQYESEMGLIKQKLDYLIVERQRDRELLELLNKKMLNLCCYLEKSQKSSVVSIGTQTTNSGALQKENLTPTNRRKTAQQTIQQLFNDQDRYPFDEFRNFCFKR